ncbi:transcriptional activator [Niveomyces insectorum RCEF 264]|uniref:Transcriptional activator n=1 Tax=Niveomyces insectorum RCEF 264 TaxID=1081102 RepID=A0A167VCT8_9HYPO|nr:transcriptional activator [Niveomyces insectorum RCEF 264]
MSQANSTGRAGVVLPPSDGNGMDQLASSILDDLLYNVIHDLVMKTHRDEKQARSATAAIRVETIAAEAAQDLAGATGESKPGGHHETDAASYENGRVTLKANPLRTTHDILCPRCHLPRLLYPVDGRGARKPDPSITYCRKHPYIDKPGCDIYGQMWVAPGPGRGKKKKDFDKKVSAAIHAATTGIESSNGGPGAGTTTEQRPPNVLSFPSATCSKCKRCILVSRLNNHMGSCIGNSGRNASRAAAQKISNGSGGGGGSGSGSATLNDHTPPSSQKGTPLPSSQGSPRKRDADDFDDDANGGYDETDGVSQMAAKPKKKFKSSASTSGLASVNGTNGANTPSASSSQNLSVALSKKLTLKMKNAAAPNGKKQKAKPSSALSFSRKAGDPKNHDDNDNDDDDYDYDNDPSRDYVNVVDDDDDDDDDDDADVDRAAGGSIHFKNSASGLGDASNGAKKKKKTLLLSATSTPPKKTTKVPIPIPGKKVKLINKTPLSPPASKNGRVRDIDAESESSGTMSSPRA